MIIYLLAQAVIALLNLLIFTSLPELPAFVGDGFSLLLDAFGRAIGLINLFIDLKVLITLVGLVMAVFAFEHIYDFVFWILGKFPMLNIRK